MRLTKLNTWHLESFTYVIESTSEAAIVANFFTLRVFQYIAMVCSNSMLATSQFLLFIRRLSDDKQWPD